MKKTNKLLLGLTALLLISTTITSCRGDSKSDKPQELGSKPDISAWEMENGFGMVKTKLNLPPINPELAKKGEKLFESKCASCHKLDEKYAGPAQRDVLRRISPEFFINMVINPDENIEKHPHIKELLGIYMLKMTNQNVNFNDARQILEYFRLLESELPSKTN
ncbi:MAG: c-type cytochrome [Ignavibacteria bacterium]|jgi:hypothetical protein|nr:c-type cytochrome [Ignavibacteria bacterium]